MSAVYSPEGAFFKMLCVQRELRRCFGQISTQQAQIAQNCVTSRRQYLNSLLDTRLNSNLKHTLLLARNATPLRQASQLL